MPSATCLLLDFIWLCGALYLQANFNTIQLIVWHIELIFMRVYCRECGSKALITEEEKVSSVFSKLYCQCTNSRSCGHCFVAHMSFSHTLKPSAVKLNNSLLERLRELPVDQQLKLFEQLYIST